LGRFLSVDADSFTETRSMSGAWLSIDNGLTWIDPPGLTPLSLEQHQVGDEGDMAHDDAGHIYYVDTYAADVTFTRWTTNGLGQVIFDYTRPIMPSPESDDRPWTTAHGNGAVFYFSNVGNKAYNGGRYTVHASYDSGLTWDYVGVSLPDSGWCRPAADHRPGSQLVYAACTNDAGKLYSYVTTDNGHTWTRYNMGTYNSGDKTTSWPTIQVGPDGTVWVLYVDSNDISATGGIPNYNQLYLFKSTDEGKTWSKQEITPVHGRYQYAWLSISSDGKMLGMGVYFRPNNGNYPWTVAGATWAVGTKPGPKNLLSLDPDHPVSPPDHLTAPADYMGSFFFPDGKLGAIWTRYVLWTSAATLTRDIYFAKQR